MRRVVVVVVDREAFEILFVLGANALDQLLRRHAELFGLQHRRRAVRVVRADVDALMTPQTLETHPDVGLDVFEQMS